MSRGRRGFKKYLNKNVIKPGKELMWNKKYLFLRITIHVWIFVSCFFNMPWYIVMEILHILTLFVLVDSIILDPVNWNASNPMFKVSNNHHVIEVNMYDEIDFNCPHYPGVTNSDSAEYYVIYKVSKASYDRCELDPKPHKNQMIVNCSKPDTRIKYTIPITDFSPIPNAAEFRRGESHYFITTSTGTVNGIDNPYQGACYHNNMKLSIKVCCESTTSASNITSALPSNSPTPSTITPSAGKVLPGGSSVSTNAASTTTQPPPRPSTTRSTTSTTRSTTTTSVKWRSSTRKHTDSPAISHKPTTKKPSDKDNGDNDTLPKNDFHTSSSISLHTNCLVALILPLLVLLLTNCLPDFTWKNR